MASVVIDAYPGIEVLPQEYAYFGNLPQRLGPPISEEKESRTPNTPGSDNREQRRADDQGPGKILSLTVLVFWGLLIVFVLVSAGALGGGIGGGLAAQRQSAGDNSAGSSGGSAAAPSTASMTLQAAGQPTGTGPHPMATFLPILQIHYAPTDGGCPGINGTRYVSPVTLRGQTVAQSFEYLCSTNYRDGPSKRYSVWGANYGG